MINNRQAGRRRGRNNPRQNGGGNRGNGDNGNRIDNRARGNAAQLLEKYRNLARDAQLAGDRVNAEYYLQFADHYFRVLADNRARQEEQQARFRRNDDGDQDGYDGDDGDDGSMDGGDDVMNERPDEHQWRDTSRDNGYRDSQPREQHGREGGNRDRDRDNGNRDSGNRDNSNRENGNRESGNRDQGNRDNSRRRPMREREDRRPVANDDAEEATGLDAAVLPPAIGRSERDAESDGSPVDTAEAPKGEAPARPRRGRRPRQPEAAE